MTSQGGGGGSATFAGDTDVSLSGLANDDQILYRTSDSKFHNVPGGMTKLGEIRVGAGGSAALTFSSIPATYKSLLLLWAGRKDAATAAVVSLRLNGDAGGNYDGQNNEGGAYGVSAAGTSMRVGVMPGSGATAGIQGSGSIVFPNYASSAVMRTLIADYVRWDDIAFPVIGQTYGGWRNASAAINAISLIPATGNFAQDSYAALYAFL